MFVVLIGAGYAGHRVSIWLNPHEQPEAASVEAPDQFGSEAFQDLGVSDQIWPPQTEEPVASHTPEIEAPSIQYFPEAIAPAFDEQEHVLLPAPDSEPTVNKVGAESPAEIEQPQTFSPEEAAEPINDAERLQHEQAIKTIRSVLPKATDEEVEIWLDAFDGLPAEAIREVLELRTKFSSLITPPIVPEPIPESPAKLAVDNTGWADSLRSLENARTTLLSNIANADTMGFRRRTVVFQETTQASANTVASSFGVDTDQQIDISPGKLVETKRGLDMAIEGSGWFQLRQEDGTLVYTRAGRFQLTDGKLQMNRGSQVLFLEPMPELGSSTLSATDVRQLRLAGFDQPSRLAAIGDCLFVANEASGIAKLTEQKSDTVGRIKQGFQERSNVRLQRELRFLKRLNSQIDALKSASN